MAIYVMQVFLSLFCGIIINPYILNLLYLVSLTLHFMQADHMSILFTVLSQVPGAMPGILGKAKLYF